MVSIYALINPIDNYVFYIGATTNPVIRLKTHISGRNLDDSFKNIQLQKIISNGDKPELLVLDQCLNKDATFWENFYIDLYSSFGFCLVQSRYSIYTHNNKRNYIEHYKTTVNKRKKIVYCTLTINRNGYCTDLKAQVNIKDYSENKVKDFLRKDFYIKTNTLH